ncbi:hypothetical protein Z517_07184 [Fonsecaea pedrosoi CBS 271.37]|uniref:Uncharacterized protein n=1 Tax=Fonsecaea pedrosoi CBS 271.37 TaxID=1442368 RepID=A0A0D2GIF5_9EURO|nr:uncharacterized protein Z517_07184 [Fonsecaea pedrosoi CBS 271.37]KIW80568.1 hypothetical protein Z517_07184 [Fonsecaea pedrosoi CBS 271.37]
MGKSRVPIPSQYELQVVRLKNTVFGRVSRYHGDFAHAADCLTLCIKAVSTESSRYHHKHHLADVLCELQRSRDAENLSKCDTEDLRIHGKQRSKAFRRLLLPRTEACIQQHKFEDAWSTLRQLDETFGSLDFLDVSDQLGHVRSIFGLVRRKCKGAI